MDRCNWIYNCSIRQLKLIVILVFSLTFFTGNANSLVVLSDYSDDALSTLNEELRSFDAKVSKESSRPNIQVFFYGSSSTTLLRYDTPLYLYGINVVQLDSSAGTGYVMQEAGDIIYHSIAFLEYTGFSSDDGVIFRVVKNATTTSNATDIAIEGGTELPFTDQADLDEDEFSFIKGDILGAYFEPDNNSTYYLRGAIGYFIVKFDE